MRPGTNCRAIKVGDKVMRTHCKTDSKVIGRFLHLCDGNWHKCIYVHCLCRENHACPLADFLFLPDKQGQPVILPRKDCNIIFSRIPDPEECLLQINSIQFKELYGSYIKTLKVPDTSCSICYIWELTIDSEYDW